ncbi:hypothetical protein RHMOL_Rhmol05G0004800 [Rhododendron molle]|uniref:Uncharacterized protein n=1 Tax=Rhododendron molle TaxID=49168 RepID=A0ACC0NK85_RHOML|nr:hypothetical protein RHMOL_Rhmol05G0004800 [Rhododendron molle]
MDLHCIDVLLNMGSLPILGYELDSKGSRKLYLDREKESKFVSVTCFRCPDQKSNKALKTLLITIRDEAA